MEIMHSRITETNVLLNQKQEVETYKSSDYAIGLIQRAIASQQNIGISGGASGELYILPKQAEYMDLLKDRASFFTKPAKELEVTLLKIEDVNVLNETLMFGRNLDELIWTATYASAKGRLMAGCKPTDVIQLTDWPNLTRLFCNSNILRLAALFTKTPTSLFVASRLLGIPQSEVYDFYSAAKASGLTETLSSQHDLKKDELKPFQNRTLLEKIISRVSSL